MTAVTCTYTQTLPELMHARALCLLTSAGSAFIGCIARDKSFCCRPMTCASVVPAGVYRSVCMSVRHTGLLYRNR